MPLQSTVVLDLSALDTASLATAGPAIASVQMCMHQGKRVIAVVSPSASRAERDLAGANRLGPTTDPSVRAAAVVAGGVEASRVFANVLAEAGIAAAAGDVQTFPATRGHAMDAEPRRVSGAAYQEALSASPVLVIPGGVGRDEEGRFTSLGAGSGSLTALFVADRLGLGVQRPGSGSESADSIGSRKAARFQERTGVRVEGLSLTGSANEGRSDRTSPPVRVALFGSDPAAELFAGWLSLIDSSVQIERYPGDAGGAAALMRDGASVVIDTASTPECAYEVGAWALRLGRSLITTNAALLAERGGGLSVSALIGGGVMRASGAVVGCPSLAPIMARNAGWPGVRRVQGTFSPAGDLILDLRASGVSAPDAERIAALELGLSVEEIGEARTGRDAFRTLGAIAPLAFNAPATVRARPRGPEHVSDADIARAAAHGRRYRVIATAERIGDAISIRVGPVPLRADDPLICDAPGSVEAIVEMRTGESVRASGRLHQPGGVACAMLGDCLQALRDPSPAAHAAPTDADRVLGITA